MNSLLRIIIAIVLLGILACFIYIGYQLSWTGFQGYLNNKEEFIPAKKLWDWMQLLIVPVILAGGAWLLNKSQKKSEQLIEADRQRQKALEDYFDCLTDLILEKNLRDICKNQEARSIARTRTLVLLNNLDPGRKGQALQFLYESGLINKNPIIRLTGANLNNARLDGATLIGAELRGVFFKNAHLRGANLTEADLRGSDFSRADLSESIMMHVNLRQTIFNEACLRKADLQNAITKETDFTGADLIDTIGTNELNLPDGVRYG
jgi:uncharacterized protein YjbI with pentapeptide repeats